ncbi:hypothetical protein BZA05DRAFT_386682 [Tricharina praecox]|uniref:uncharacterized protein n=1 Tax=Tricharina praecox TaxID=43433 RepID=UPI00221E3D4D|nr:uncharacterized protein BZA05DRAFT_386682 [Tricharina praecox]KAI5856930.1 hypothetical protein BZA05DRAFT_386682 [Tricharina praecox]
MHSADTRCLPLPTDLRLMLVLTTIITSLFARVQCSGRQGKNRQQNGPLPSLNPSLLLLLSRSPLWSRPFCPASSNRSFRGPLRRYLLYIHASITSRSLAVDGPVDVMHRLSNRPVALGANPSQKPQAHTHSHPHLTFCLCGPPAYIPPKH